MNFVFPERIPLAQLPTPIQKLSRLSVVLGGPEIYIKRDDLTGIEVSGNKIRKLEFVAAHAIREGYDMLITGGGIQSNHARATAATAARLGLACHLILQGDVIPDIPGGNTLLDYLFGAKITYVPDDSPPLLEQMQQLAAEYAKQGKKALVIPIGASDAIGSLGYAAMIQEMQAQFKEMNWMPDVIATTTGSGGTLAGLLLGKKIFDLPAKIAAFSVSADKAKSQDKVRQVLDEFQARYGVTATLDENDVQIFDEYVGPGYAQSYPEELQFIAQVARLEGVIVDPTYTGKAFYGLAQEIKKGTFTKQQKVLFIHTGGIFGLFSFAADLMKIAR